MAPGWGRVGVIGDTGGGLGEQAFWRRMKNTWEDSNLGGSQDTQLDALFVFSSCVFEATYAKFFRSAIETQSQEVKKKRNPKRQAS